MLETYPIHVVFAAHEMTPNITPVLDARLNVQKVMVFYTDNMRSSADRLHDLYTKHQKSVVLCQLRSAFDNRLLIEDLRHFLANHDLKKIAFNISCGTKINAVATVMTFRESAGAIYYVLPNDELYWLTPVNQVGFNLADNIRLDEFIRLHSASRFVVTKLDSNETVFANSVIDLLVLKTLDKGCYDSFQMFSSMFHKKNPIKLIRTSKGYRWQQATGQNADIFVDFFHFLSKQGLASLVENDGYIRLAKVPPNWQRLIVGGGWLEYWVYRTLRQLQPRIPQIQDVAMGAKVFFDETSDEVDIMFLVNNQLCVIECKSGGSANINHHLHRINSLRKSLGGVLAHAGYITTVQLAKHSAYRDKAERLQDVLLLDRKDLLHLETRLEHWIRSKLLPQNIDQ